MDAGKEEDSRHQGGYTQERKKDIREEREIGREGDTEKEGERKREGGTQGRMRRQGREGGKISIRFSIGADQ